MAPRSVSVVLGMFRVASLSNGGVRCPRCSKALALHQPDEENPDRLLGVCGRCSDWYLVDSRPDRPEWEVVPLPDASFFRNVPES